MPRWLIILALPLCVSAADIGLPSRDRAPRPTADRASHDHPAPPTDAAHALDALAKIHPRLGLTPARVARIRELVQRDPSIRKTWQETIGAADAARRDAPAPPTAHGTSSLPISRAYADRIAAAGMAWQITGKEEYADAVRGHVLAACAFAGWTGAPKAGEEFGMETGEMLQGIALGYDWAFDRFTVAERATVRAAIVAKGLTPGLHDFGVGGARSWWPGSYVNCTADDDVGLIMGALAIGDEEPAIAREVLTRALEDLAHPIATYDPDGVWPEGPSYWYTTTIAVALGLSSLETAVGSCVGLDRHPGLAGTGRFILATRSPSGFAANFADSFDWEDLQGMPMLLWLARHYDRPDYARAQIDTINAPHNHGCALDVLWWPDAQPAAAVAPLDARFAGRCDVAAMRSGWDADALYAWVKGGWNDVNHGHLDLGEFELYALGRCWSRDLGRDDYGLPGNHEYAQGGKRWTYFRWGSQGHSVPLIDGEGQLVGGSAQIARWHEGGGDPSAIVELKDAYRGARGAARGLMLVGRRALLVQDEIALAQPCPVTWAMTTDAAIAVDGAHAVLTIDGRRLAASILAPAKAVFSVASGERPAPEQPNTGVKRLLIELPPSTDRLRIAVLLAPDWKDGVQAAPALRPLGEWGTPAKPTKAAGKRDGGDGAASTKDPADGAADGASDAPSRRAPP